MNYISQRKKKNDDDDSDDNDEELKQQQQQRVYIDKLQFFSGFSKLCKNVNWLMLLIYTATSVYNVVEVERTSQGEHAINWEVE